MSLKIDANSNDPPIGALITADLIISSNKATIEINYPKVWKLNSNIQLLDKNKVICDSNEGVARYLARTYDDSLYGGEDILERTQIDSWMTFCLGQLSCRKTFEIALEELNNSLKTRTYLVGGKLTLADIFIYSTLSSNNNLTGKIQGLPNINRWYKLIKSLPSINNLPNMEKVTKLQGKDTKNVGGTNVRKQEGKFIDLPGAEMGKVVVRFPPEASGYLHIGHAKAALLNQYYAELFDGTLIMRFDDTNPAKENVEYEQAILKDLELLEIKPHRFTHSSDYFDIMLKYCEELIKNDKAFVDNTSAEQMKEEREQRLPSKNRNNSVELNLKLWNEMINGTKIGQENCVRAKIDCQSANGCMRDPTIYRCKPESHPRTGKKYNVYPTYDFACPIVDSIEGVTHTLRTTEYHDRDDQFYWFIQALNLRRPYIYEYSRLNMTNTVLSKRKLTWFVDEKIVDGWDDPRFPTVRGILRRGMTVNGLKQFIIAQGSSRSVVFMEWDKIWAFNKKVIDPIAIRYTGLNANDLVSVIVDGDIGNERNLTVQNHPKDPKIGMKNVKISRRLFIERCDAELLTEGQNATFVNWGNLMIEKIERTNGTIDKIKVKLNLENKDFKNTVKLTWLAGDDSNENQSIENATSDLIPCVAVYFDHIISKAVLGKDDDFKNFVAKDTRREIELLGESELKRVKENEIIQLQRKGFFRCDVSYAPLSDLTSRVRPLILFHIPDGHVTAPASTKESKEIPGPSPNTDVGGIIERINIQGNKVRDLKAAKADKKLIDAEVKELLSLKAEYKKITGNDWKPGVVACETVTSGDKLSQNNASELLVKLNESIQDQGNKVRDLKAAKADKETIAGEVKKLLGLKEEFKKVSGSDWKPGAVSSSSKSPEKSLSDVGLINKKIEDQGNKVRELKAGKADKETIAGEVKKLLGLKEEFKKVSGSDWKPQTSVKSTTMSSETSETLNKKITDQGDKIRKLKSDKCEKKLIDDEIKILLNLKNDYKILTGNEWKPPVSANDSNKKRKPIEKTPKKEKPKDLQTAKESESIKTGTRLGLEARKNENLSDWYSQVIVKGEMIEYYDVSGCYILRPWSYSIWDMIKDFLDSEIKKLGVQNCYFPIFVSKSVLEREKTHIADFAPEVAWVTKSGESELAEPIAIRPTSETVMYPAYSKWLKSHRDLPLKLNQWNNVVRWEFKHPQPFLRTREFLWQEGHSAFLTKEEATDEVMVILELYARVYEDLLAIPVVRGRKTEKEKFAGGDYTTTIEAFISASGRAIQGATSHHLGQNFSKMFDIQVENADESGEKIFVYQNSWGLTTRTIGVMIMVHGDDKGLVLPPKIASVQVIIVPCGITATTTIDQRKNLMDECSKLEKELNKDGILKVKTDYRDNYSPGWKFNHWELKGVPLRIELGFKDLEKNQVTLVRRDNSERILSDRSKIFVTVNETLDKIQRNMLEKANIELKEHIKSCNDWGNFCKELDKKNLLLSPFCGEINCEDKIKADSTREDSGDEPGAPSMGAKSLCIPFEQPKDVPLTSLKCIHPSCKNKPKFHTLFGRSY